MSIIEKTHSGMTEKITEMPLNAVLILVAVLLIAALVIFALWKPSAQNVEQIAGAISKLISPGA